MSKIGKLAVLTLFVFVLLFSLSNVSAAQYNLNNKNSSESVSDLLDFDLEDGDTIFLEDGVYENFSLSFSKSININANPGKVHLKGSGSGYGIEGDADYINISNIQLSNYEVGIYLSGSSFYLNNVISNNNKESGIYIMGDEGTTVFKNVVTNNNGENGVEISSFNKLNIYNLTANNNKDNGLTMSYGGSCNIYNSTFNNNYNSGVDIYDYDSLNIFNSKSVGNTNSLFSMDGNYKISGSDFKDIVKDGEPIENKTITKFVNKSKFMTIVLKLKKDIYYHKLYAIANIGKAYGTKNFKIKIPKGYTLVGYSVNTRVVATYSGISKVVTFKINKLPVYNNKTNNLALIYVALVKNNKKGFAPVNFVLGKGYKKLSANKFKITGLGYVSYKSYIKGKTNIKVQFLYNGVPFRNVEFIKNGSKITTITKHIGGTKTKQYASTNAKITTYYKLYMNILKKASKKI